MKELAARVGFAMLRVWLGVQWFQAGWEKLVGGNFSAAGFVKGAIGKAAGDHPAVQGWYAAFLQNVVLPQVDLFSSLVVWGEILVGVGLILGVFTGFAALAGAFMNLNFMLAGTTSTNPILYTAAIAVILGVKYAEQFGLDYYWRPIVDRTVDRLVDRLFQKGGSEVRS